MDLKREMGVACLVVEHATPECAGVVHFHLFEWHVAATCTVCGPLPIVVIHGSQVGT